MNQQLEVAIRHSLAGHARNRLAAVLLVVFVPVWYLLIGAMIPHASVGFRLRATGTTLLVDGHNLSLISAGLNTITIIAGFVVLTATRRAMPFDRRLVLSGYGPGALIAAKTAAAVTVAIVVGCYAALSCSRSGDLPGCGPSRWRSSSLPSLTPPWACSSASWSAATWKASS